MRAAALADDLERRLREAGRPERAEAEKAYLKSELEHFGASVPAVRRVVKETVPPGLSRSQLLAVVRALWRRPVHECRAAAAELLEQRVALLEPGDLALLEQLIRESRTWALVDNLAASVAGPLIERHPELAPELDRWAGDPDLWVRRSALLAELVPLREGRGDFDRFARHADAMLDARELFIRKAIGWVLRDTSRKRPELVYGWLLPRAARASGVTVREAVKRLPDAQREAVLRCRTTQAAGRSDRQAQ